MEDIFSRSGISENTPPMTEPLVQILAYNGITEWGDNMLLGEEVDNTSGNLHTRKFLKHLNSVAGDILENTLPLA